MTQLNREVALVTGGARTSTFTALAKFWMTSRKSIKFRSSYLFRGFPELTKS